MNMHRRKKRKGYAFIKIGLWFIPAIIIFLIFYFKPKFWDSKEKLVMATHKENGGIVVSVIDARGPSSWIDIIIPGSLQVQVAGELGSWKLGSVWQLGVNEKKEGGLLLKTIVKNLGFPVFVWSDEGSGKTNLSPGDRLRLAVLKLKFGRDFVKTLDLTQTSYLKKTRFVDGEGGYAVFGEMSSSIAASFSDDGNFGKNPQAKIINASGYWGLGEKYGRVIEALGVKIASIQNDEAGDFDCYLSGGNIKLVKRLNLVFECEIKPVEKNEEFAAVLEIGRNFIRRF